MTQLGIGSEVKPTLPVMVSKFYLKQEKSSLQRQTELPADGSGRYLFVDYSGWAPSLLCTPSRKHPLSGQQKVAGLRQLPFGRRCCALCGSSQRNRPYGSRCCSREPESSVRVRQAERLCRLSIGEHRKRPILSGLAWEAKTAQREL